MNIKEISPVTILQSLEINFDIFQVKPLGITDFAPYLF